VTTAGETFAMARVIAVWRLADIESLMAARAPATCAAEESAGPEQPA
jgi:hypothetical protein